MQSAESRLAASALVAVELLRRTVERETTNNARAAGDQSSAGSMMFERRVD